jgi:hypothetical protein
MAIPKGKKLTRRQTADALTEAGYVTSEATLATMATRGGGPPFRKFGPRVIYEWESTLEWAEAKLSEPRTSTSEREARAA